MRQRSEPLIISGILMHWNFDDALQDGINLVLGLLAFFVLDVLIPEGMRQEVETNVGSSAFEEPKEGSVVGTASAEGDRVGRMGRMQIQEGIDVQTVNPPPMTDGEQLKLCATGKA